MAVGFDSNILVYLAGGRRSDADDAKVAAIQRLYLRLLERAELVVPVQALGEATHVLARKFGASEDAMLNELARWEDGFTLVPTTIEMIRTAVSLATAHRFQHWDAVIVDAAVVGGCDILLSEDMQHGSVWRGLTIVNPFAATPHPALAALLA